MKISLIAINISECPYPVYPLGMSVIARIAKEEKASVFQFDYLYLNKNLELIYKELDIVKPDIIGFSIRNVDNTNMAHKNNYSNETIDTIKKIKDRYKGALTIIGGSGFSLFPDIYLKYTGVDFGFVGSSESSFRQFLKNYKIGILPKGKIIYSNRDDGILSPLYQNNILKFYLQFGSIAPVQTKRGCPHKCTYCTYPAIEGKRVIYRNCKKVVDEIERVKKEFEAKMIFFTDSVFNDNRKNFLKILEEMIRRKISIPWTAFFKPEIFSKEELYIMERSGLEYIELGADAANDTTLKALGKDFNFQKVKECAKQFIKIGIYPLIYYIIGGPEEDKKTLYESINNIKSIDKAVSIIFMGIRIYPNTKIEQIALEEKIIEKDEPLFEPKYYLSKQLDKELVHNTLLNAFNRNSHCIYPPDSMDKKLKLLHSIGCRGLGLEKMLKI